MKQIKDAALHVEDLPPSDALLKAQQRAVAGQLALELMHDLRNPLEALGHLTYLALQEADDPAKVRNYLGMAQEQMKILGELASQPLDFTRTSSSPILTNLVQVADAALRIHHRAIKAKNIKLTKDFPENAFAKVYGTEILQVISNLILNSVDALPETGILHIRLRSCEPSITILVADNGHGIPKENAAAVFMPFFTTKESRGTGLGLALTKRIIAHHHGTIRMRSCVTAGRNGTVFRISLPCE